jgi:hypothetical protein
MYMYLCKTDTERQQQHILQSSVYNFTSIRM